MVQVWIYVFYITWLGAPLLQLVNSGSEINLNLVTYIILKKFVIII